MEEPVGPVGEQGALKVRLKVFEGPLDLLLHLIRNSKIDIYDIPMAEITAQYLEYLDWMKNLNLDVASEFLVMAATLTHIKSRMLLPAGEGDEDEEDPRNELVQRLLEYQQYKEASLQLRHMLTARSSLYGRLPEAAPEAREEVFLEVSIFELLTAFREVISLSEEGPAMVIQPDKFTVVDKMRMIMDLLEKGEEITFRGLFQPGSGRGELVASFLAILELARLRMMRIVQEGPEGEIRMLRVEN
jgi:segregation and condensation protein A